MFSKRLLAIFAALILLFQLAACSEHSQCEMKRGGKGAALKICGEDLADDTHYINRENRH